jgi:L,D-transpeptidase ErfK/SrfK
MRHTPDLSRFPSLRLLAPLCLCLVALSGCATAMKHFPEQPAPVPAHAAQKFERTDFALAGGDNVIGRLAVMRLEPGDTLPDIARHFGLGINALSAANPGIDVWVPKAGERVLLPLSFTLPDAPRKGIVVNLATMRLFQFKGDGTAPKVTTYPVGIGTGERPTPTGQMFVKRKAAQPTWHVPASIAEDHRKKGDPLPAEIPPGPLNPLGDYALYLSKPGYLVHGTNKPASIGLQATNGCLRLYPENVKALFDDTPVRTPVLIVNQPYLIGQRDGVLYLEAHAPLEGSGGGELEKANARLRALEKSAARPLDWDKIRKVQGEARGIPVPILAMGGGTEPAAMETVTAEHPERLYGQPETPALNLEGWYVLAATVRDESDARRLAAIISHQGPPIPARVLAKGESSRVVAGPFKDFGEAGEARRRLKIDLNMDGIVMEPVRNHLPSPAVEQGNAERKGGDGG